MNSRTKGKRGELELAQLLRNQGWIDARRGQQYKIVPFYTPDLPFLSQARQR